jgi:hypothetical protein
MPTVIPGHHRTGRSGPPPDPYSARSAVRRLGWEHLPAEGRTGEPPAAFPLSRVHFHHDPHTHDAEAPCRRFRRRELAIWGELWHYPQALAWEQQPWRWHALAELARLTARVENDLAAPIALWNHVHRFRDELGLTPTGLKENHWIIDTPYPASTDQPNQHQPESAADIRLRLLR